MDSPAPTERRAMDPFGRGVVAGFVATLVLSLSHDLVALLTDAVGAPSNIVGWLFHFFVGTMLWGGGFGLLHDRLWGPGWLRGVVFAFGAALLVMLVVMPMTGAGVLGLNMGFAAPIVILLIHLVYGAVLGAVYDALGEPSEARAEDHPDTAR